MEWIECEKEVLARAEKRLGEILDPVCSSHGLLHAKCVADHTQAAISASAVPIPERTAFLLTLASLLHDADDHKFFGENSQNAVDIMEYCSDGKMSKEDVSFVLMLIDFVSCSKNGDSVPDIAQDHPEYLFPRHSDRLEALGEIGVRRCYQYNVGKGAPFFCETTPRPTSAAQVWEYASKERYAKYSGGSDSMLDHYYDKLLHLSKGIPENNSYYKSVKDQRDQILVDICVHYGRTGTLHPIFEKL